MCLKTQIPWPMLAETERIGRKLLKENDVYRLIGDRLFEQLNQEEYKGLLSTSFRGRGFVVYPSTWTLYTCVSIYWAQKTQLSVYFYRLCSKHETGISLAGWTSSASSTTYPVQVCQQYL